MTNFIKRDVPMYLKTGVFGLLVFGLCYGYLLWAKTPSELNKSLADTAVLLMSFSMLASSLSYFWNVWSWVMNYRKYLGLIGFAFAIAHLLLSWDAFLTLFNLTTITTSKEWPFVAGALGLLIFTIMAVISNTMAARALGALTWRRILRTGYLALSLIWLHIILLKSARWITWYQGGLKTLPSLSLIVTCFVTIVVLLRLLLWWSLSRRRSVRRR